MIALLFAAVAAQPEPAILLQLNADVYRCGPPRVPVYEVAAKLAHGALVYEDRDCVRLTPPGEPEPEWTDGLTEQQLAQIAYIVCGPEGTNDGIENGTAACERSGWNGRAYGAVHHPAGGAK